MPFLFAVLLLLAPAAVRADVAYSDSPDLTLNTLGISPGVGGVASADSPDFTLVTAAARVDPDVQLGILATSGGIKLHFVVFPGDTWSIQASTNLAAWVTVGSFTADANGVIEYDDPASAYLPARYYRAVSP